MVDEVKQKDLVSKSISVNILAYFQKNLNIISLIIALIALGAFFASENPVFLSNANLINVLRSAALLGIITWGMTLVILLGEIDVSVGQATGFSAVLLGWLATTHNIPFWIAVVLVLVIVTMMSYGGGYIRARFNVPSFVTTLALYSIYDGLKQVLSNNIPIPIESADENFMAVGSGNLWGIPYIVIIAVFFLLIFAYVAKNTTYGRSIFAVGGNGKAAYASGINVTKIRASVFAINGFLAAITGLLYVSRLGISTGAVADGLEFSAIAAVVIGGTSLSGGRGSMIGSVIGVLFTSAIANGLVLMGVNSQAQGIVRGFLILVAVLMNVIFKKENKTI
jgi:sugar transport system permease protein